MPACNPIPRGGMIHAGSEKRGFRKPGTRRRRPRALALPTAGTRIGMGWPRRVLSATVARPGSPYDRDPGRTIQMGLDQAQWPSSCSARR